MKMKIIFPVILLLITTISCKKEKDNQNNCRINRIINGTGTYEFNYGNDGKLSTMVLLPDNEKSTYEYDGKTTTITVTKNGNFRRRWIITNNNNGFASNILLHENESGSDWYNQAITYEGKRMVRNKVTDSGGDSATGYYIWEGGNPVVFINQGDMIHYDYYEEKKWQIGDWRNIQQLITGYKTYEYENLFKSSEINGNWTYYTYLYDEAGRVIEATGMSKNITNVYTIEYACK